ncbi:MAG: P-loop NTPase [Bacteroidales bacterium]
MKEIIVLSGKGGTGKTSVTSALASLFSNAVFCDCDVDAADLHLIFSPQIKKTESFPSSSLLEINTDLCLQCGLCESLCRFEAIEISGDIYKINEHLCESCRLCERVCPNNAISYIPREDNQWMRSKSRFGDMVHAEMGIGEENSGRLVAKVRQEALNISDKKDSQFILTDGPPGIGCPVISSLSRANYVILIAEPSMSSLHDLERLAKLVNRFKIPMFGIVNKYDLNFELSQNIISFFKENNVQILGDIPFSEKMVEAVQKGESIIEYAPECELSISFKKIFEKLMKNLEL